MRRFLGTVLLAALAATTFPATASASAMPAETRESRSSMWQAVLDLLRPVFGTSESDGRPGDPHGLAAPPHGGAEGENNEGSGSSDGSPEADPDG